FAPSKVIECFLRHPDNIVVDEYRTFTGTVFGMLQRTFPLHHGPTFEVVSRQLAEYGLEIHLAIAQRAESASALHPARVAAVYPLFARGVKFSILHMEGLDAFVVMVDIREVIQ